MPRDFIAFLPLRDIALAAISDAFEFVTLDDGITLHQARALDNWEPPKTCLAARVKDTEVHWKEIPDEKLRDLNDVHPFLCPRALRFYLPAYMSWALRVIGTPDDLGLSWSTIAAIDPKFGATLNEAQNKAVALFWQCLLVADNDEDAMRALEGFWKPFAPKHPDDDIVRTRFSTRSSR